MRKPEYTVLYFETACEEGVVRVVQMISETFTNRDEAFEKFDAFETKAYWSDNECVVRITSNPWS